MSIRLYMDVHVPFAITAELRLRGMDVLTAQEDGAAELSDEELLDRALRAGRLLVTQDIGLLREAARRLESNRKFAGVVYAAQLNVTIGRCVRDLELICQVSEAEEWLNRVEFLPLK